MFYVTGIANCAIIILHSARRNNTLSKQLLVVVLSLVHTGDKVDFDFLSPLSGQNRPHGRYCRLEVGKSVLSPVDFVTRSVGLHTDTGDKIDRKVDKIKQS